LLTGLFDSLTPCVLVTLQNGISAEERATIHLLDPEDQRLKLFQLTTKPCWAGIFSNFDPLPLTLRRAPVATDWVLQESSFLLR
jgi:hypothetical protein